MGWRWRDKRKTGSKRGREGGQSGVRSECLAGALVDGDDAIGVRLGVVVEIDARDARVAWHPREGRRVMLVDACVRAEHRRFPVQQSASGTGREWEWY